MNELEFLKDIQEQSLSTYGSILDDYTPIPTQVGLQTREQVIADYKKSNKAEAINQEYNSLELVNNDKKDTKLKEEYSEPHKEEKEVMTETKETYSYDGYSDRVPVGSVPTGYKAGRVCGNCEYYSCGLCYAFDYPCHSLYTCDAHKFIGEEVIKEEEYEEDLTDEVEEEVEKLSEGRTEGGNVTAEARSENATLSKGRFPIFDKKSARSALKLRGKTKTKRERNKVIAKAAKYDSKAASKAKQKDEDENKKEKLSMIIPTRPRLWELADIRANGDEEMKLEIYGQVVAELFGEGQTLFIEESTEEEEIVEEGVEEEGNKEEEDESKSEKLSIEFGGSISAPQMVDGEYLGASEEEEVKDSKGKKKGTLLAIAETRVKSKYRKKGEDLSTVIKNPRYIEEVQKEYERLVVARSR